MRKTIKEKGGLFLAKRDQRPCWFVDAKWIFALLFIVAFTASLGFYNLLVATDRETAVETLTGLTEDVLEKSEGELTAAIDEYQDSLSKVAETAEVTTIKERPLGQALSAFFPDAEILKMPAADLKKGFLQKVATSAYEGGTKAVFGLLGHLDYAKYIDEGLSNFKIFSDETHEQIQTWFTMSVVATIVFLVGLVYFSARFGKFFAVGVSMMIASSPGFVFYQYLFNAVKNQLGEMAERGVQGLGGVVQVILIRSVESNLAEMTSAMTLWFYLGVVLVVIGVGGGIVMRARDKRRGEVG